MLNRTRIDDRLAWVARLSRGAPHTTAARRHSLVIAGAVLVSLLACCVASPWARVHGARRGRPNIVVVLTDDQTTADLSVMHETRRLLKRTGTTFTNSFATYALCCPSRTTLLTGQYAHNHGVLANRPPHGGYPAFRREVNPHHTLPVYLHRAGYRTGLVGKFLNYYGTTVPLEIPEGWDYWQALTIGESWMYGYTLDSNGHLVTHGSSPSDYQTDVLSRKADRFVRASAGRRRPFFLLLAPGAPHEEPASFFPPHPHRNPRPAPRDLNRFDHRRLPHPPSFNERQIGDKPPFLRPPRLDRTDRRDLLRLYRSRLECLLAVDDAVRRLVHNLRITGELDNTVIIFTSDNGYLLGEHRLQGKGLPYQESVRVPLIIRGPGFPAGARRSQLAANIDLAPTIVDLAHARGRRRMDGVPLTRLARDPALGAGRDILFERSRFEGKAFASVRTARWVFTKYAPRGRELYDLTQDPYEIHNRGRSPAYAVVRKALLPRLRALRHCKRSECRAVRGDEPLPPPRSFRVTHTPEYGRARFATP
jgi:N-acetylglucosamine-6-sulfatase